jgi:galactose mutarotase-like enzyme
MRATAPAAAASAGSVRLEGGDLAVTIAAAELLEVRSLRHAGDELLVAAAALPPAATVHGRAAGITLLHPWANRLGRDAYAVGGVRAGLPAGDGAVARDANGLALHGLTAPPGAWRWEESGADRAVARLDHAGGVGGSGSPFPFPHTLRAAFALRATRLEITTTLTATGSVAVPVAFGWHPYLRLPGSTRACWRLALPARRHLTLDAEGLPTGAHRDEPADEAPLGARTLDDGFDQLAPGAWLGLRDTVRRIRLRLLDGYPVAQVFAPPDADVVSLEPMTAPVNALVTGRGLSTVAPGESFRATFALDVRGYPGRR